MRCMPKLNAKWISFQMQFASAITQLGTDVDFMYIVHEGPRDNSNSDSQSEREFPDSELVIG